MRLINWNSWLKEDPKNIIKLIEEYNPDVFCLQELTQNYYRQDFKDIPKVISEATGYEYIFGVAQAFQKEDGIMNQGNAIFSKHKILKTYEFKLKENTDLFVKDYSKEGRLYLLCEIEVDNKVINIATVHLSTSINSEEESANLEERDKLINLISKNTAGNYILCGDFNIDEKSKVIKDIESYLGNLGPDYGTKTWTTKPFDYKEHKINKLQSRIDFVFGTKSINVINAQIINTDYSDHLPILIDFEF